MSILVQIAGMVVFMVGCLFTGALIYSKIGVNYLIFAYVQVMWVVALFTLLEAWLEYRHDQRVNQAQARWNAVTGAS